MIILMMKLWTLIIFCLFIFTQAAQAIIFNSNCVIPPLECPNENITFWLYTRTERYGKKEAIMNIYRNLSFIKADIKFRANEKNPVVLKITEPDSIISAPWVKDAPIKILIHGYTGYRDFSPNTEIRPAYIECCDYNIISVHYNKLVLEPCYLQAARNTELTGKCIAQFIDELVQKYGFALSDFHVIGFSLGAHTAGYMANYLESGKFYRITALDPALPLFASADRKNKIDSSDAYFVDVLHTNALQNGKLEDSGHVDFYANGGMTQPGCVDTENQTKSSCEHHRAPQFYAESITTKKGFYASKCKSWFAYMMGWCQGVPFDEEIIFGEYVPINASGSYFFDTYSKSPYALGPRRNKKGQQ